LLVLSTPAISHAELISYFSSALEGWSGTLSLSGTSSQPKVDIQYAIYGPGVFNDVFGSGDPSDGEMYVYCYQLINKSTTKTITYFTIGLDTNSATGQGEMNDPITPIGTPAVSYWIAESSSQYTSAVWSYSGGAIPTYTNGGKSKILFYASSHAPSQYETSSVMSGIYGISGLLPTPAPEPSALISLFGLLSAGGLYVLVRRV
jgi:hypothetical protein